MKRKREDKVEQFTQYRARDLAKCIKGSKMLSAFDMSKLEPECEYETDQDHITQGKKVLETDLYHAVEFFIQENPILFVENLDTRI